MLQNSTLSASRRLALQIVPIAGAKCDATARAIPFTALSATLLNTMKPALVLSWLYTEDHDAMDIATRLGEVGFRGCLRVFTRPLLRPGMVRRELASCCPQMTLELEEIEVTAAPLHAYDDFIANPETNGQDMTCLRLLA